MRAPRWSVMFVFCLASLVIGCATGSTTYSLYPARGEVTWAWGVASVEKEIDGVRVATAFESRYDDSLQFRVVVYNGTEEHLSISPQLVRYAICSAASCGPAVRVIDPEEMLAKLEARARDEQALENLSRGPLGTLVLVGTVSDIASVTNGHAHRGTGVTTYAAANLTRGSASTNSALSDLEEQKQLWANVALRPNALPPGQTGTGRVFVPLFPEARYVWLRVRVGARTFSFPFEQTSSSPPPPAPRKFSQNRDDSF